jgi:hypothetical protein
LTEATISSAPGLNQNKKAEPERLRLGRNFLHAAELEFEHPATGKPLALETPLPAELAAFLSGLEEDSTDVPRAPTAGAQVNRPKTRPIGRIGRE